MKILRDVAGDCIVSLDSRSEDINLSQTTVALDYLLLENEVLRMHLNNSPLSLIIQTIKIDALVQEHPKRMTNVHINLLKLKFKHFMLSNVTEEKPLEQENNFQPH